jgi:hypothetical protein
LPQIKTRLHKSSTGSWLIINMIVDHDSKIIINTLKSLVAELDSIPYSELTGIEEKLLRKGCLALDWLWEKNQHGEVLIRRGP